MNECTRLMSPETAEIMYVLLGLTGLVFLWILLVFFSMFLGSLFND
jgi:uncharacterized membrane protein YuzA (DUF378 family)